MDTWSYAEIEPYVRSLVRRALGSSPDSRDAVQEVFCRVVRHHGKLRDVRALRPWVRSITFSVITDLRRARRRDPVLLDPDAETSVDLRPNIEARARLRQLAGKMQRLSLQERSAFALRYIEDYSFLEIAAIEGYSLATARRRLKRPMRILERLSAQAG